MLTLNGNLPSGRHYLVKVQLEQRKENLKNCIKVLLFIYLFKPVFNLFIPGDFVALYL